MREFFTSFAKESRFDPLVAANWYTVKAESVHTRPVFFLSSSSSFFSFVVFLVTYLYSKRARFVMAHYKGSLSKTLMHAFPNIGLHESQFALVPSMFFFFFFVHLLFFLFISFIKCILF